MRMTMLTENPQAGTPHTRLDERKAASAAASGRTSRRGWRRSGQLIALVLCAVGWTTVGRADPEDVVTFDTSTGDITHSQPFGADVKSIVKDGDGTLTLTVASPDFPATSSVEVRKGTLKIQHADALGPSLGVTGALAAPIAVREGATLFLNLPARTSGENTYPLFANHPIAVGGAGVDGKGAIRFEPSSYDKVCDGLLGPLTLTSDTTLANTARMGFVPSHDAAAPNGTAPFDLGGHTLTLSGQSVFLHKITLQNGKVRVNARAELKLEAGGNVLNPDRPGEILLNGGTLGLNSVPTADGWGQNWKIVFEQASTLSANAAAHGFAGDVVLAGAAAGTLDVAAGGRLSFLGGTYGGSKTLFGDGSEKPRTGTVTFKSATVSNDVMVSRGVGATFDGGSLDVGQFQVGTEGTFRNGATNVFCNGVRVNVRPEGGYYWNVQSVNQLGALVFSNSTVSAGGSTTKMIRLAVDGSETRGLVRIEEGASLDLSIGNVANRGRGLVVQNGGAVTNRCRTEIGGFSRLNDLTTICKGRGFYALNGGEWSFARESLSLGGSRGGRGWLIQTGGRLVYGPDIRPWLSLRKVGYGEYALLGGVFVCERAGGELALSESGNEADILDGSSVGVLTLAGAETAFRTKGWLATLSTNASETVVNVREGATLSAQALKCRTAEGAAADAYPEAKVFVNLDGGVIRPAGGASLDAAFFSGSRKPDAVTLYDGGVVFDTAERLDAGGAPVDVTLGVALKKATGKGLATISLPTDEAFAREEYLTPARVHIASSGNGRYATALAVFDGNAMTLTGVRVTSPGCDYDEATTTVEIESATNNNVRFACAFTLKDNAGTGGVTKRGAGRWTLDAADDFGGDVTVEGGELALPGDASLAGRKIRLTCAALFGDGVLSCAGTLDVTGTSLEIVDPENLPSYADRRRALFLSAAKLVGKLSLAADYGKFSLTQSSGRCRFGFARGIAVIIR